MRNDDYYMELNESIVLMDKRTEGPGDARFHFHEDYEIFLFLEGDVDLYIEQSVHHMQRGHLAVFNDREDPTAPAITAKSPFTGLPYIFIPGWCMECALRPRIFWAASRTTGQEKTTSSCFQRNRRRRCFA